MPVRPWGVTKIKVFMLLADNFIALSGTTEGYGLFRAIEIELVNCRFAELKRQAVAFGDSKS